MWGVHIKLFVTMCLIVCFCVSSSLNIDGLLVTSSRPSQRSGLVDVIRISTDDIRGECVIAFGLWMRKGTISGLQNYSIQQTNLPRRSHVHVLSVVWGV